VNVQKIEISSREYTNERNIYSIGNIELTKRYLVKKILLIVRVCDEDVILKTACLNALDRQLPG
jgi:hypothetical protein